MNILKQLYYKAADNPILGWIPLQVFVLTDFFAPYSTSLLAGYLGCSIMSLVFITLRGKRKIYTPLFLITAVATLAFINVLYFIPACDDLLNSFYSPLLVEVIFILILLMSVVFRRYAQQHIIDTAKRTVASSIIDSINEYVYISSILLYTLTIHVIVTGIFILLRIKHNYIVDVIIVWAFPSIFAVFMLFFEYIRLSYLQTELDNEEWLAVVDEKGKVIGKIAKSETGETRNKYLYPLVRIAVAYQGRLFLSPRAEKTLPDTGKPDHPFEKYVLYEHTLEETTASILKKNGYTQDRKPCFSIKYLFENEKIRHLIFLYTLEVFDECFFNRQKFPEGKFWTQKQIEENLNINFFPECFEKEYEYLKNTLLLFCSPSPQNDDNFEFLKPA